MDEWVRCFAREVAWFGGSVDLWLRSMFIGLVVYCFNSAAHNLFK